MKLIQRYISINQIINATILKYQAKFNLYVSDYIPVYFINDLSTKHFLKDCLKKKNEERCV